MSHILYFGPVVDVLEKGVHVLSQFCTMLWW